MLLPVLQVLFIEYGCCIFIGLKASYLYNEKYLYHVMPLSYSLSSNLWCLVNQNYFFWLINHYGLVLYTSVYVTNTSEDAINCFNIKPVQLWNDYFYSLLISYYSFIAVKSLFNSPHLKNKKMPHTDTN